MDQKLKGLGQNSALEFNTKLLNLMEDKADMNKSKMEARST